MGMEVLDMASGWSVNNDHNINRIVVEPPRVRTIAFVTPLHTTWYRRLAFPWVVRWDRLVEYAPPAGALSKYHTVARPYQMAWTTLEAPTWDTPLCMFPLATYMKGKREREEIIHPSSHYNEVGHVCYSTTIKSDTPMDVLLWHSLHKVYNREEVEAWAELTKEFGIEAVLALKYREIVYRGLDGNPMPWPVTLRTTVGKNLDKRRLTMEHFQNIPGDEIFDTPVPASGTINLRAP